jgi:hypothetical protein
MLDTGDRVTCSPTWAEKGIPGTVTMVHPEDRVVVVQPDDKNAGPYAFDFNDVERVD